MLEPAADWFHASCSLPYQYLRRIRRGHVPGRSPDVYMVPRQPNYFGGFSTTTHSGPWPYVQRVPLVLYGPGYIARKGNMTRRDTTLADLAPTLAQLTNTRLGGNRSGKPIAGAVSGRRAPPPRLIVVIVWDGGGWNVLRTWPHSWPYLRKLMREGTSVTNATVGFSPSVSPTVHATIGTGAFPRDHGIADMVVRVSPGQVVDSFEGNSPQHLEMPTYGDVHDLATRSAARVGMFAYHTFHTVMMGHGAYLPGGDHDIQIIAPSSPSPSFLTNPDYYMLPAYLARMTGLRAIARRIDARDGKRDTRWRGHDLDDPHDVRHSPVWVRLQTRILKEVLRREGFGRDAVTDLFFANYKQIDDAGHDWNMLDPSMSDILEETDRGLRELVRFLNRSVGERRYVLAVTADHGQAPAPIRAHAWPIGMEKLAADITTRFDADHIIQETRPTGLWTSGAAMTRSGTSARELARYLIHYRLEDNVDDDSDIPPQYIDRRREPVLAAAFPAAQLDRVWRCAQRRHRS